MTFLKFLNFFEIFGQFCHFMLITGRDMAVLKKRPNLASFCCFWLQNIVGTKPFLAASDFQLTEVLTRIMVPDNIGYGGGGRGTLLGTRLFGVQMFWCGIMLSAFIMTWLWSLHLKSVLVTIFFLGVPLSFLILKLKSWNLKGKIQNFEIYKWVFSFLMWDE